MNPMKRKMMRLLKIERFEDKITRFELFWENKYKLMPHEKNKIECLAAFLINEDDVDSQRDVI